jgi:VanZ family protein
VLIKSNLFRLLQRLSLVAVILMIVMIFGLGHSSLATSTFSLQPPLDKCLHASVYGMMAALLVFSGTLRHGLIVLLLVFCIGAFDEFHQISIPGREASLWDLVADAIGASIGIIVMNRLLSLFKVEA